MTLSLAYQYGYGLFETIKIENYKLLFLQDHINRLISSAPKLNMPTSHLHDIQDKAYLYIKENNIKNGILKIIYSKDTNYKISFIYRENPYKPSMYQRGFSLNISSTKRNPYSNLVSVKSNNYLENLLEKINSKETGFDEPLFLNIDNYVSEGATSNIFFVKDSTLYTPSLDCGLLNGILRQNIIKYCNENKIRIVEDKFTLDFLLSCDEIFITNSILEIMPVYRINTQIFHVSDYVITKKLQKHFCDYMRKEGI